MLEIIYEIIKAKPGFFAWAFGLVNVLWGGFLYFNKKGHERELVALKASIEHSHNLDLEKRRRLYEMKATQFEKYFRMIDDFGKKNQVDMPRRMQPIFKEYFSSYLEAQQNNDNEASRNAITLFGERVNLLMSEGYEDYMTIQAETNSLKLIATDQLAKIFSQLEKQYGEAFKLSQRFMADFVEMTLHGDNEKIEAYQRDMSEQGTATKATAEALMGQMRAELQEI